MGDCDLCAHTLEQANLSRPTNASNPSVQKLIGYQIQQSFADSSVPVAQWLEHCVSSAKVVGSIPREHMY